jgi:hypothetical protein
MNPTTVTPDRLEGAPIAKREVPAGSAHAPQAASPLPGDQRAFHLLHAAYVLVPLLMGIDKFAHVLTDNWTRYLADWMNSIIPGTAGQAMHMVGIVEIAAALIVLVKPKYGAPVVAAWLAGIVVSLLSVGGYGDIVVRDLALLGGALALTSMAWARNRKES